MTIHNSKIFGIDTALIKASHASDGFAPLRVADIEQMVILLAILLAVASSVFALEKVLRYLTRSTGRLFRVEPCRRTESRHCEMAGPKRADSVVRRRRSKKGSIAWLCPGSQLEIS